MRKIITFYIFYIKLPPMGRKLKKLIEMEETGKKEQTLKNGKKTEETKRNRKKQVKDKEKKKEKNWEK